MSGGRIAQAREAAVTAIDGLVTGLAKPRQWSEQRRLLRQMDSQGASVGTRH